MDLSYPISDGHFLKPNHGNQSPGDLCFLGVATKRLDDDDVPHVETRTLRCGHAHFLRREKGYVTRELELRFEHGDELWDAIIKRTRKRTPLWVFAYDVPEVFTFCGGWRVLRRGRLGFEWREVQPLKSCKPEKRSAKWKGLFVDSDPPVVMQLWTERGSKVFLVDVRNYFDAPLQDLADRQGIALPRMPHGKHVTIAARTCAETHVQIARETMLELIDQHQANDLGNWGLTIAGLAMRNYRHAHYRTNILLHGRDKVKRLERDGTLGGRVEAFRIGQIRERVIQLDVNGIYPWVMRNFQLPCKLVACWDDAWTGKCTPDSLDEDQVAHVRISSPDQAFPVRLADRGLCWATGDFWTTLCGGELRRAVAAGVIRKVTRWAAYRRENLFQSYVDYWHQYRQEARAESDAVGDAFAKLMAVCLFGRWGMRSFNWKSISSTRSLPDEWLGLTDEEIRHWLWLTEDDDGRRIPIVIVGENEDVELRRVGNHWQVAQRPGETPQNFPAICAWITSYAREYLRHLIAVAGRANVIYVSTDSLLVTDPGFAALDAKGFIGGDELGQLKIEAEGKSAEVLATHYYRVGRKRVKGNTPLATLDGRVAPDGEVISDRLQTLIRRGHSATVRRRVLKVDRDPVYLRGNIDADGFVTPLHLPQDAPQ